MSGLGLLGALMQGGGQGLVSASNWMAKGIEEDRKDEREMKLMQMRDEIETNRALKLDETKRSRDKAEKTERAANIEARAQTLVGDRVDLPAGAEEEAQAGAVRINDMRGEGLISPTEAEAGYREVEKQRDAKGTKAKPTTSDYMKAQAQEDGDWTKVAASESKEAAMETRQKIAELQQSTAFAKMDMQYQIALAQLDAKLAKGLASGNVPTQIQQIEYLVREHGMSKEDARALVYHPEGKVGEYVSTQTKTTKDDGTEVTTTEKRKVGAKNTAAANPAAVGWGITRKQ